MTVDGSAWPPERKYEMVRRVIRGEPIAALVHETGLPAETINGWHEGFIKAGKATLHTSSRSDAAPNLTPEAEADNAGERTDRDNQELITHLDGVQESIRKEVRRQSQSTYRRIESLLWLKDALMLRWHLPPTGGWAADPDFLLHVHELIRERQPGLVLELGSGVSSVVIADALRQVGAGRLVTLDHLEEFANITAAFLKRENLTSYAEVRLAPLTAVATPSGETPWYDPKKVADLSEIELLIVDGPPAKTAKQVRYPALPVLQDRLANGCCILLDDAGRKDEQAILARWGDELRLNYWVDKSFEKGLGLITWRRAD